MILMGFLPPLAHSVEDDSVNSQPDQHEEVMGEATEKAVPLFWDIKWNF